MIIHKLIAHHLAHRDDLHFYTLQARDAIRWMEQRFVQSGKGEAAGERGGGECRTRKAGCKPALRAVHAAV